ncbi:MAG: hypothetical protein QOD86_2945 [Miltoncostaeaceae bacterium]|nr:hypothetical protein [Miltoncostaeaceae bacterium]
MAAAAIAAAATAVALSAAPATSSPGRAGAEVAPAAGAALHRQIMEKGREIRQAYVERRRLREQLAERIVEVYRSGPPEPLELVLTSDSLSDAFENYRLLERISGLDAGLAAAVKGSAGRIRELKAQREALREAWRDRLAAIAHCESRGRPDAVSPGGQYRGKYQFDLTTWNAVGGRGDPAAAPEWEQDRLAAKLYRQRGPQPWPVCGPPAG